MVYRNYLALLGFIGLLLCDGMALFASEPGKKSDTGERRRRHHGQRKQDRSHVRKWRGHHDRQGRRGKQGEWKKRWHGGQDFEQHRSHMWHKYGWFWDADTKSWYQCTPIEDPKRGYGCEYKGKWYPMRKSTSPAMSVKPTMPKIEEVEEDEDIVEAGEQPMPTIEEVD